MSLIDSKGMLSSATKDLLARWNDVKTVWSDAQSRAFEETFLVQIENEVRNAFGALDNMDQVLQRLKNDCE